MKQKKENSSFVKEVEDLFSLPKKETVSPLGVIGYKKEESGPVACYFGDYCHFDLSISSGNIKNLSIFCFCIGYMIQRHQIFRSFNEYQGSFDISQDKNQEYRISSKFTIHTFDTMLNGTGTGYIDRKENTIHLSYCEKTGLQLQNQKSYQFQIERLENDVLLHIYDEKERKLLESFLLEGKKQLEDIPYCDLENKSLKKIFEGRRNEDN